MSCSLCFQILLSFGASPNYRDAKGLTPLYHTAIMGDDMGACISLLRYRAELGIQDQGGWTELHHVRARVIGLGLGLGPGPGRMDRVTSCHCMYRARARARVIGLGLGQGLGIQDQGGWTELHHVRARARD